MRGPGSISTVRGVGKREQVMEQQPLSNPGRVPRLDRCFLCGAWALEADLKAIEVPDQNGWIEKKACQECLDKINGEKSED